MVLLCVVLIFLPARLLPRGPSVPLCPTEPASWWLRTYKLITSKQQQWVLEDGKFFKCLRENAVRDLFRRRIDEPKMLSFLGSYWMDVLHQKERVNKGRGRHRIWGIQCGRPGIVSPRTLSCWLKEWVIQWEWSGTCWLSWKKGRTFRMWTTVSVYLENHWLLLTE